MSSAPKVSMSLFVMADAEANGEAAIASARARAAAAVSRVVFIIGTIPRMSDFSEIVTPKTSKIGYCEVFLVHAFLEGIPLGKTWCQNFFKKF